jgi:type IV secretory pathway TrbL component
MVKDNGNATSETQIDMKDSIKMIRNGVMECLLGQVVTYIKEITRQISEMEWAKCIG